ncbi:MAG: hypothetical protein ACXAAO_06350 [Candidatus Thorarchaeota archaeon]|jgi:hypothetical protein
MEFRKIHSSKCLGLTVASLMLLGILFSGASASQFIPAVGPTFITYFGGSNVEDATKVAFDNDGNTILIGQTQSDNLPTTDDAFQPDEGGGDWDAFIAKFSPLGELLFCSYLGGTEYEHITAINVDNDNNMIVAGTTMSSGLPTSSGALHETPLGSTDGFVFVIAPNGTVLYGTYLGGLGEDWIYGMEFDASGNYLFAGWTTTFGLATSGVYQSNYAGGGGDAFVARLSADCTTLEMFSYVGGSGDDKAWSMTVDDSYNYVISGVASAGFPTTGAAYQSTHGGDYDAFLTVIPYTGNSLNFSTFLGGTSDDLGVGVDVDSQGDIILTGDTQSDDISTLNAVQGNFAGGSNDFFASKFNSTGHPYYVTYIGGNETDRCWDARVDIDDNLVLVGRTNSVDFPATNNGLNDTKSAGFDACVTKLASDGQTILASTFIGGGGEDIGEGIAVNSLGDLVVTGRTWSLDFPVTGGAYQQNKTGLSDVFICQAPFQSRVVTETTTTGSTTPTQPPGEDFSLVYAAVGGIVVIAILTVLLTRKN